jgi:hypothetical protein
VNGFFEFVELAEILRQHCFAYETAINQPIAFPSVNATNSINSINPITTMRPTNSINPTNPMNPINPTNCPAFYENKQI